MRQVDKLGRIVIPKEMRERFSIEKSVEILVTEAGVLIRNPEYILVRKEDFESKGD